MERRDKVPSFFYFSCKKVLDKCAGVLYNKDRSEEERKTLGPTANLRFFKLFARDRTTLTLMEKVWKKSKKGVAISAGLWYNLIEEKERGSKP